MKETVAILDDDKVFVDLFKRLLEQWAEKENHDFAIDGFSRPEELVSSEKTYDLVFMDVVMPESNGIELFEKLKESGRLKSVVYVSAYDKNVFDIFGSGPIGYIRKAFVESDLKEAMELYRKHLWKIKVYIMEGKKVHCFYPEEIMYLKSNKHYIEFYMGDEKQYLIRGKMDDMEEALRNYGFIRIHASYLVNLKYIRCVDKNRILLNNCCCCRVSMKYRKEVYRRFCGGE